MDHAYEDIIGLRRPVHRDDVFSRRHPSMTRLNRAKLFAPFAALAGFEEVVREKDTPYVPRRVPDAEESRALNALLNALYPLARTGAAARQSRVSARVEYFAVCTDVNSAAYGRLGLYRAVTGVIQRVDPTLRLLLIANRIIPFDDIRAITDPSGRPLALSRK